jgi:hypothetical protein
LANVESKAATGSTPGRRVSTRRIDGHAIQAHRSPDTPPSRTGYKKPPPTGQLENPQGLWDCNNWCKASGFSKTKLYALWRTGIGPKRVVIGSSVRILESPREYAERIAREQAAQEGSTHA